MTQENKSDAREEIRQKIGNEFGETHEFINVPEITKLLAEMREITIDVTTEKIKEEIERKIIECKKRLPKLRGNAWIREHGDMRAYGYLREFLAKFGVSVDGEKDSVKKDSRNGHVTPTKSTSEQDKGVEK